MNPKKRVAIVFPWSKLDTVPCVMDTINLLAQNGYWVDVFTRFNTKFLEPTFQNKHISVIPIDNPFSYSFPKVSRLLPIQVTSWLSRLLPTRVSVWLYLQTSLLFRHRKVPYVCVIGVDPKGLIKAEPIARRVGVSLAYFSLELLLSYEVIKEEHRKLKMKERRLSQLASFVIIQDEERANLLIRDNELSEDKIILVPNAPLGQASQKRTQYLHQKFDLHPKTKIILHSGSLADWTCAYQLMHSTQDWPDDWVLVCHSRSTNISRSYLNALNYLAKKNRVLFSTEPLSSKEYPELVRSADIGVAFYCPQPGEVLLQDNIRFVGLSSGKLASYLQAGLPVIVNGVPSLKRLVGNYKCGEVTENPAVTHPVIQRILSDYQTYSKKAVTCFNQKFDFKGKFDQVLYTLKRM